MNLKLFYSPPWKAFVPPEKPTNVCPVCKGKGWITGLEHPCTNCNYGGEWRSSKTAYERYNQAYAEAKANALEVGNPELIQTNFHGVVFIPTGIGEIKSAKPYDKGEEIDWKGSAVIKDGEYILSI